MPRSTRPTSASTSRTTSRSGSFFPAPGVGRLDERDRRLDGPGRAAGAGRAAARRPGRRRGAARRSSRRSRQEAERRVTEWATTGHGLVSSSLYDACAWFSTGLGDDHTHDAQLGFFVCGYNDDIWRAACASTRRVLRRRRHASSAPDAESVIVLANPVQPHSEGEIVLTSADPLDAPGHPHELLRRPPRHGRDGRGAAPGARHRRPLAGRRARPAARPAGSSRPSTATWPARRPSDALLDDLARHYSFTVYHLTSHVPDGQRRGCRGCGSRACDGLRVADASVMPNVVSGNTNAAVDHDRREGGGDARRRPRGQAGRVRRRRRLTPFVRGSGRPGDRYRVENGCGRPRSSRHWLGERPRARLNARLNASAES